MAATLGSADLRFDGAFPRFLVVPALFFAGRTAQCSSPQLGNVLLAALCCLGGSCGFLRIYSAVTGHDFAAGSPVWHTTLQGLGAGLDHWLLGKSVHSAQPLGGSSQHPLLPAAPAGLHTAVPPSELLRMSASPEERGALSVSV